MKLSFVTFVLALAVLVTQNSCQKVDVADPSMEESAQGLELKKAEANFFYSSTQPLGNGVVRAWVEVDRVGNPKSVGVDLSAKALMNLPDEIVPLVLELPKTKGHQFYTHAMVDWNPHGHEPPGVYDHAHFDFHFYTAPNEDRMQIPFIEPPYMDPAPAEKYIPANYIQLPGLVPQMGAHWVDVTSPELNGWPFTYTFIWGSYNGGFIFWEPMVTLDYLLEKPDDVIPIPQPEAYQKSGWYAKDYVIKYSGKPDQVTIALVNLTYHEAQ